MPGRKGGGTGARAQKRGITQINKCTDPVRDLLWAVVGKHGQLLHQKGCRVSAGLVLTELFLLTLTGTLDRAMREASCMRA